MVESNFKINIQNLGVSYGSKVALRDISMDIEANEIFGIIGPAQSGKTTFLRTLNRTIDLERDVTVKGTIKMDNSDILVANSPTPSKKLKRSGVKDIYGYRRRIGMVAPLPVGLPMSVYENVAFAPKLRGVRGAELDEIVERCLTRAALWDEVKDRLKSLGSLLSGGQQQRLTIARALSQEPELLLLDEFSIAVDPVTTMRIEDVLKELKEEMTIILVTNLVQQARRLADRTAFFLNGEVVEVGDTAELFTRNAQDQRTTDYVEGRFG